MLTKVLPALLLFALLAMLLAIGLYTHEKGQVKELSHALATTQQARDDAVKANGSLTATIMDLQKDAREKERLAIEAKAREDAIKAKYDNKNQTFKDLKRDDPPTRDWASVPLPAAVARLHDETGQAPSSGGNPNGVPVPARATSVR